jgi:MerR family transcriptional regulator, light-induced transcriptional regulator
MHSFNIRDMEHLTGIKAHTIRIWEQRHQLVAPKRKESLHRTYDTEDLKFLLRITFLYKKGYRISEIASMTSREIDELVLQSGRVGDYESLINQLMEASIDLDEEQFQQTLDNLKTSIGIETAVIHVVYPYFEKIGLLWITGNVIPAQEHFASNLVRNWVLKNMPPNPTYDGIIMPATLLLCPPNEHHEIPILFLQYLFRQNGKPAINFGINTSIDILQEYLQKQHANVILVYLITSFLHSGPSDYLRQLLEMFPSQDVVAAGPAFVQVDISSDRLKIMRSLDELLAYAKS